MHAGDLIFLSRYYTRKVFSLMISFAASVIHALLSSREIFKVPVIHEAVTMSMHRALVARR
jgi:hypothetical protein